jgi:antitoxin MazE
MHLSKLDISAVVRLAKALVNKLGLEPSDQSDATTAETKGDQRKAALERMAARNWPLPPDYKFDRDEANER